MEFGHPPVGPPPSTPGPRNSHHTPSTNMILGSDHTAVPPSPGMPVPDISSLTMGPSSGPPLQAPPGRKPVRKKNVLTGAGIRKPEFKKKKPDGTVAKLVEAAFGEKTRASDKALEQPFRFMDLPGGKQRFLPCFMASANRRQNCAMRSTSTRTTAQSKRFWCTVHGLRLYALAPVSIAPVLLRLTLQVKSTTTSCRPSAVAASSKSRSRLRARPTAHSTA